MKDYTSVVPLAYLSKLDCASVLCRRTSTNLCAGWHCSYCDAPCSSQGHKCEAAEALIGEAQRVDKETS